MRLHVVSLPWTQTDGTFSHCAYTEKVRKFCNMMMGLGDEVYLYAGDRNTAACTEFVSCFTEAERLENPGGVDYFNATWDASHPTWIKFNAIVCAAMTTRIKPKDFICLITGSQKLIADIFPANMAVEFGVGYTGVFSKYRVWESYAWMHLNYAGGDPYKADGVWFDAVIPNYFEPEEFSFSETKSDYYLYLGRIIDRKGWRIAADVCRDINKPLILAGPGTPPNREERRANNWSLEHVGLANAEARKELLKNAKAIFVPTIYIEPFGGVAVEAMLSGTPAITTDWGAFTETNPHGLSGYRCRHYADFLWAAEHVGDLNALAIREWALSRYSLGAIGPQYRRYFERLNSLWKTGWPEKSY